MGASALSSMEDPWTKAPAAIITGESYPGMSHGSGVTKLSTGAAAWIPWQKAMTPSGVPKVMDWIIWNLEKGFKKTEKEVSKLTKDASKKASKLKSSAKKETTKVKRKIFGR